MHGKNWTPDEDAILAAHYPTGRAAACIAHGLARTRHAMKSRAEKIGLACPRKKKVRTKAPKVAEAPWPMPRHDQLESLDCIRLRKWRGPVDRSRALRAAA